MRHGGISLLSTKHKWILNSLQEIQDSKCFHIMLWIQILMRAKCPPYIAATPVLLLKNSHVQSSEICSTEGYRNSQTCAPWNIYIYIHTHLHIIHIHIYSVNNIWYPKKAWEDFKQKWSIFKYIETHIFVYMRSVQRVSSHVIWKIETFIEEDIRYKKHYT